MESGSGRKILKHVLLLLVGLALLAALLQVARVEELGRLFTDLAWIPLLLALAATFGNIATLAARWGYIANRLAGGRVAAWADYFHYFAVGRALGFVIPKDVSDLASRTIGLNQLHGLGLAKSGVSVLLDRLSDLLGTGLLLVAVIPYWAGWVDAVTGLWLMAGVALVAGLLVLFVRGRLPLAGGARVINRMLGIMARIPGFGRVARVRLPEQDLDIELLRPVYFLSMAKFVCMTSRLVFFAFALRLDLSPALIILGTPLGQLSYLVAFTPGGLGIFEMGWFGVLKWGGVESDTAVLFVVGQRVFTVLMICLIAAVSQVLYTLRNRSARAPR